MDDTTLEKLESLHLGVQQTLSEHEYSSEVDPKIDGAGKMSQSSKSRQEVSTEHVNSTPSNSYQPPLINPVQLPRMTRSQTKALALRGSTLDGPCDQYGQSFGSLPQRSNDSQYHSQAGQSTPNQTRTKPQTRQPNPKANIWPPYPRSMTNQMETEQSFHRQKASLSTEATTPNLTLPARPKHSAKLPRRDTQASSSLNDSPRGRHRGAKKDITKQDVVRKYTNRDKLIHLPAPEPSKSYLAKVNTSASRLPTPQKLLLVLDLNGTLLFRVDRGKQYVPRPGLDAFLDYCFSNHSVLIWSSSRPHNVASVCKKVFNPAQHKLLLGRWGRDTFGLTPEHYEQRVQVYKDLEIVWRNSEIQSQHPNFSTGGRWKQENTVLIDDSVLKAAAQPFNLIEVLEFEKSNDPAEGGGRVLEQVKSKLEDIRGWDDVSALMRAQQDGDMAKVVHDSLCVKEEKRHSASQDPHTV